MAAPLAPDLFASLDPIALAGSRCDACGTVQFPAAGQCAHCAQDDPQPITLPSVGTIWTWTIQRFPPKLPYEPPQAGFSAFAVGYVDLGEVLVESILDVDLKRIEIGMSVRLARRPLDDGDAPFTFAFSST